MVCMHRMSFCAVLLALAFSASSLKADAPANPRFNAWSGFKIGSSATRTATMGAGGMTINIDIKETLVELTDDHAVIETVTTTSVGGQDHPGQPVRTTISSKDQPKEWKELRQEDVQAAGKTYKCKVIQGKFAAPARGGQAADSDAKIWFSSEVPGGIVQVKVSTTGPNGQALEMTMLLKSIDAK